MVWSDCNAQLLCNSNASATVRPEALPNLASRLVLFLAQDTAIYRSGHTYLENASWTLTYPKDKSKLPAVVEIRRWECDGMVLAKSSEPGLLISLVVILALSFVKFTQELR